MAAGCRTARSKSKSKPRWKMLRLWFGNIFLRVKVRANVSNAANRFPKPSAKLYRACNYVLAAKKKPTSNSFSDDLF